MEKLNGNTVLIKEVNINIVREALKKNSSVTKPQIAKETGLTSATVGTILNDLLEKNEILELLLKARSILSRKMMEHFLALLQQTVQ